MPSAAYCSSSLISTLRPFLPNALFQDTVQMTLKFIEANKDFEVAFYAKDDHSIRRDDRRVHVSAAS